MIWLSQLGNMRLCPVPDFYLSFPEICLLDGSSFFYGSCRTSVEACYYNKQLVAGLASIRLQLQLLSLQRFFFLTYLVTTIRRWRGHCVFKLFDRDSESTSWFLPYGFLVLTLTTPQQDLFCFRSLTVTQTRPWTSLLTLINSNNLETAGIHLKS